MTLKAHVLFPCYIYPSPGAWDPLHQTIKDFPNVNFTIIINPGNGPGPDAVPDACYQHEIPVLVKYSNVTVIGYIHTSYASRDIKAVKRDVEVYSKWAESSGVSGLAVEGVFVDEAPWKYDDKSAKYLKDLRSFVKNRKGFGLQSRTILNPGCVPDSRYLTHAFTDSTVIFEDTYETLKTRQADRTFGTLKGRRDPSELACVVHSIPMMLKDADYLMFVRQVQQLAGGIFLTEQSQDYYSSFAPEWRRFVAAMAAQQ